MNLKSIKDEVSSQLHGEEIAHGEILFHNCDCQILSQSAVSIDFLVNTASESKTAEYSLLIGGGHGGVFELTPAVNNKPVAWDRFSYACLLQYEQELSLLDPRVKIEHKKYTRQGMIKRVLTERRQKAEKAPYHIRWANNIYGDHTLTNEHDMKYKIFLRDFEAETGYSDSWDSRLNKLGTTKHIMFAFDELKKNPELFERMDKTYPFIEVFCDPLNEYRITWHYPHKLPVDEQLLISRHFKKQNYIENTESAIKSFLGFIEKAAEFEMICIRPEVTEKVERVFEQSLLKELEQTHKPAYPLIKAELYPYQKEGVEFVLFKKAAVIADEMGLGKTLQAAAAAVFKKQVFGFSKTLVVCPATLKSQWKKEIEAFTNEKALIVDGKPNEREVLYLDDNYFFFIVNYETVLRDSLAINKAGIDFLILDEAQKIKNFETKTSSAIKRLQPKHTLVITGTPIENRLIDIFSIISVLDPYFLGPLWEFSYQHCLFDPEKINKINGYYNLQELNVKLADILIRREKRNVLDQMPNVLQVDIPVELSPKQAEYHASYAKGIASIIRKKFLTAYDLQRLQLLLANMRMVCDSTYLIDEETNVSPKMAELEHILLEQFDLKNTDRKVIIFSEWIKVHKLIGQLLRQNKIGFVELNGKVPVKLRGDMIRKFENSPECKVFLSTEAGGAGLNLQIADTLINFELPWNPAKKNQRIGRIDRLGQKSNKLTIYNLITRDSIEQQIAAGLLVKQNLFESVLDGGNKTDYVDFSSKGRSQFIDQLETFVNLPKDEGDAEDISGSAPEGTMEHEDELTEDIGFAYFENEDADKPQAPEKEATEKEAAEKEAPEKEAAEKEAAEKQKAMPGESEVKAVELEQVMDSGMQFLAGLFKMSTGKELGLENQKITVNKETGEVTMTFKLGLS
ncbi:MAG: DEAD/DEAH box helicase [Clostridiales Family XIII bacterium]|nr:DEAD/DEAH box helicase [Clostridiales Family XIII bacterium]